MASLSTESNLSAPTKQLGTVTESSSAQSFASAAPLPGTTEPATDPAALPTTTETITDPAPPSTPAALPAVPSKTTSTVPEPESLPITEPVLSVPAIEPVATEPAPAVPIAPIPLASLQTVTLPTIPVAVPTAGIDVPRTVSTAQVPVAVPAASLPAGTLPTIPVAVPTSGSALQLVSTTQSPVAVPSANSLPATITAVPETLAKPASAIAPSIAKTTKWVHLTHSLDTHVLTVPRTMRKRDMIKLVRPMLTVAPECFPILVLLAQKNAAGTNIKPIIDLMIAAAGP
ncbi:hypothetical protein yc1106_04397 [Curvularia clavata]|uniref:Uncharacterized protein n=1 Tax=Curvularia clavata TaxID=95742 RepID=A0A9Q9DR60_CURCL|nr:hypothetical protein yc1106_04397 [Curvularia clavata]